MLPTIFVTAPKPSSQNLGQYNSFYAAFLIHCKINIKSDTTATA